MKLKDYVIVGLMFVVVGMGAMLQKKNEPVSNQVPSELIQQPDEKGKKFQSPYEAKQIKNTLTKHMGELQPCYLDYLAKKPKDTEGKVDVDWYVKTNGSVEKAEIVTTTFEDKTVGECVVKILSSWNFPPPPGDKNVYVTHSFFFRDINKPQQSNAPILENVAPKK
jgi:hypothetical protein